MVNGPRAGLALLGTLDGDDRMAHNHRLEAVRAHLLERAGELGAARDSYRKAARMTASIPEQRYLARSEEHTSELQSHFNLVCRLLLEKKKLANDARALTKP